MSLRFESMVSLWLRPDTTADYLTELCVRVRFAGAGAGGAAGGVP